MIFILNFISENFIHGLLLLSILSLPVLYYLKNTPFVSAYTRPIRLSVFLLLLSLIFLEGGLNYKQEVDFAVAQERVEVAKKETKSEQVNVKTVIEYVDRIQIIKVKGDAIIKEIPKYKYITKYDSYCPLPVNFVLQHNALVSNTEVPDSTDYNNEESSTIAPSSALSTIGENYTTYHQCAEQVRTLQQWIIDQGKIYNGK